MPKPRKHFAQHWLKSDRVLEQIVAAAVLSERDRLLEIGPGTGNLTRRLLPHVAALVAVELDRDLCKQLVQHLGSKDNFLLLQGDILDLNLETLLRDFPRFQSPNKVVANIPYNITGPILQRLLGTISQPRQPAYDSIVLLVQKEICDRLCATPGTKTFGALSVRVQYLATCEKICHVPAKAFSPPPKVDSAVIRITPFTRDTPEHNPKRLETLIKLGFANKRKMLRNNLKSLIPPTQLTQLLETLNLNPQARAEDLSVENWITLSKKI
ncbi:16S rRNA (adenine(1518)-N(6)/adenine(1519)-N(6))-dimethyltransferase RsmA [Spirulina sp. CS-785/01]|uniref:16S rRNA (adenine(1518)-N(6)/adenine(1519)-N(6))- dimethyltransferase RsmA n=1 Tax=Spirulina sp. CS-785/01 TaxID=3021716 RepID=UPI00232ECDE4|nr:16S rRNA (adenine(1518)-N(6)/adenine(1519)-N(6))-dimethyltransferase RsmA [Spirulina sp. CS-785/01]MDB9314863.1 16S rRNA (adenine(1518)-N(6)/adenine(1519)-N(6))-dimethyltransferase RsmA [Spirulina sp. CS-785/01]